MCEGSCPGFINDKERCNLQEVCFLCYSLCFWSLLLLLALYNSESSHRGAPKLVDSSVPNELRRRVSSELFSS